MPPKKRFVLSTTVRWSYFDIALFRYLSDLTQRTTNDILRDSVRVAARLTPGFSVKDFEAFARKTVLREAEPGPLKDAFVAELTRFASTRNPNEDTVDEFTSKPEDFVFDQ